MHRLFLLTIFLIKTSFVESSSTHKPYIRGGRNAYIEDYPWTAMISVELGNNRVAFCTGSIIGDQWVLTAEHCIQNITHDQVEVFVGSHFREAGSRFYAANIYTVQGNDVQPRISQDLGLIKTEIKFSFNRRISPIPLWPGRIIHIDWPLQVAGFGLIDRARSTNRLKSVNNLRKFPLNQCYRVFHRNFPNEARSIWNNSRYLLCTKTPGIAHMSGDSGAGIVIQHNHRRYLVAVTSYGGGRIHEAVGSPTVHTKVYAHLGWITVITGIEPAPSSQIA